jgi:hypothetical protein
MRGREYGSKTSSPMSKHFSHRQLPCRERSNIVLNVLSVLPRRRRARRWPCGASDAPRAAEFHSFRASQRRDVSQRPREADHRRAWRSIAWRSRHAGVGDAFKRLAHPLMMPWRARIEAMVRYLEGIQELWESKAGYVTVNVSMNVQPPGSGSPRRHDPAGLPLAESDGRRMLIAHRPCPSVPVGSSSSGSYSGEDSRVIRTNPRAAGWAQAICH